MVHGSAKHGKSGLEAEQSWDAHESTSLEAKELKEQVTDGPRGSIWQVDSDQIIGDPDV